jgi:excisionase family DNA binding protein
MPESRLAFSIAELAAKTSTSIPFIRTQIRRGKLKAARVGRRVLVTPESAHTWLTGLTNSK